MARPSAAGAGPDPLEDALARATVLQQASKAGFKKLKDSSTTTAYGVFALLKQRIEQRNFAEWERLGTVADQEAPSELYTRVRIEMIAAERARVLEIRRSGQVASEVISQVLGMLDLEESMLDIATESREGLRPTAEQRRHRRSCDDLDAFPPSRRPPTPTAPTACVRVWRGWRSEQCLACGNVACCDSSPRRHATAHFHEYQHPVMESAEPGEDWRWCYFHHPRCDRPTRG